MLIELFMKGKTIICETCGFDYNPPPNAKDLVSNISMESESSEDISEQEAAEDFDASQESEVTDTDNDLSEDNDQNEDSNAGNSVENKSKITTEHEFKNYQDTNLQQPQQPQQPSWAQPPPIDQTGKFSQITEKNILKALSGNWRSMRELARDLNVQDAREFYVLRMTLNDMNRKGLITMDFQIDRVLIRRKR